jgi:phage terminase large subunit-like protein
MAKRLRGIQKPRLGSKPLTRYASRADEVLAFAEKLGWELMPWQKYVLVESLRVDKNNEWIRTFNGVLVARQQGKSALMRLRLLAGLYLWGETWIAMAQTLKQAEHQLYQGYEDLVQAGLWDDATMKFWQSNGRQKLKIGKGSWTILAANKDAVRGFTGSLWIDEIRDVSSESFSAAVPITTSYPNAQVYVTSNAGSDHSTVLNELRSNALTSPDKSFGWYEWSADPDLSHLDPQAWMQANPAMGYRMKEKVLHEALRTDTIEAFLTERLCRWIRARLSPWVLNSVESCAVEGLTFEPENATWFAFDVSVDRKRADLVAAQQQDDKVKFGLVQSWEIEMGVIDDVKIASDIADFARRYFTQSIAYDKWTSGAIAQRLASAGFVVADTSGAAFAQACDETLTGFNSKRLMHTGNELMVTHFMACVKKNASDGGWRVVRRDSHSSISAAVAAIMAIHHASKVQREGAIYF